MNVIRNIKIVLTKGVKSLLLTCMKGVENNIKLNYYLDTETDIFEVQEL